MKTAISSLSSLFLLEQCFEMLFCDKSHLDGAAGRWGGGAAHLQRDHRDLTFAVAARGLPVLAGLFHVVTQVSSQHFFFAVSADT